MKRERRGDFVRTSCDSCGATGLWVKVGAKALDHEERHAHGLIWLPSLCSDCMETNDRKEPKK